ncbi:MAG: hypothetical protein HW397_615 [Dehalococcoidia bacterium]|nr:hypothetical protein [Dehalococcoidia bacterium]
MTNQTKKESLAGADVREMFASGMGWLDVQVEYVNSLNVFPVPDGDTGTNLLLTMRSALVEAARTDSTSASEMVAALAKGALMGARGNAGVIFSQIMRGLQEGFQGKQTLTGLDMPNAFQHASTFAYKAVAKPVEGTILTVVREVAEALGEQTGQRALPAVFDLAAKTAQEWVLRTPDLMPLLRENGVVDSGAQGLAIILEGMSHYLNGEAMHLKELPQFRGQRYGYCTEFFIEGAQTAVDTIRAEFEASAVSVMVAGDQELIKVHLHTLDPEAFFARARILGTLGPVKVEDMDAQHRDWRRKRAASSATGKTGVVAVAAGEGIQELLRSLGVAQIIHGGQTMNPSTREILDAIMAVPLSGVIVLPNNKNILMAANQAKSLVEGKQVLIVPTENVPEGISAMIGFNYELNADENAEAMEEARSEVRTGEVSHSVRLSKLNGREVALGDAIGLQHDKVVAASPDTNTVLLDLVAVLGVELGSTVTLYYGADISRQQAEQARLHLQQRYPGAEVQTFAGGQPHYSYFVSVE